MRLSLTMASPFLKWLKKSSCILSRSWLANLPPPLILNVTGSGFRRVSMKTAQSSSGTMP